MEYSTMSYIYLHFATTECAWDRQIDERKKLSRSIWGGSVEVGAFFHTRCFIPL